MKRLNWKFIDGDGLPPTDMPVLVYRPNARAMAIIDCDVRRDIHHGEFSYTKPGEPVVAWVPISEVMETLP